MKTLSGKTVLITGASTGIGYQLAKHLAWDGCRLILVSRNEQALARVAQELNQQGTQVKIFAADVSDRQAAENIAAEILGEYSGLDLLINNAGIGFHGELAEMSPHDWEQLMNTNMWGALNYIYAFLPSMKQRRSGHIVNISSGQAFFRLPTWGAYAAIKTCLGVFSEILHFELIKYDIRVTTVYPYMVDTGFYEGVAGTTFWGRKSMELLPYYSQSPEKAARKIHKAITKGKRVTLVSPFNWLGRIILACPPLACITSRIANWALARRIAD